MGKLIYDNEILNSFNNLLPYLPYFFEDDVSFGIANTERYLKVQFNPNLDLELNIGDIIPKGGAVHMAIKNNKIIIKTVPKEVYGVPFRSCAIPVHNKQGVVAGCIVIVISLLKKNKLINLLQNISDRKNIAELQSKYTLQLEESNLKLKNEIKDRLLAEERLFHFVYYDALTKIYNRKKILEEINLLIENKAEKFAVLFIDLDNFKSANDNYGYESGDLLLIEVAKRLDTNIGPTDIVGRSGGDEFIAVIRDIKCPSVAKNIANKLMKLISNVFVYNGKDIYIGASIGISLFPEHGDNVDTLIKNADLAMYEVKNNGGYGCTLYNKIMNDKNVHKLEIEENLKHALEKNEFIAYYQPILDLKSMKISGSESLIRWKQDGEIIQPLEFISIAKKTGDMVSIDNWMLYNACVQCKKWQNLHHKNFSISVNTSYKQLIQLNFVQLVMNILHEQLLDSRYLSLEITEDEAMEDINLVIKVFLELKSHGIKVSMDDFGTGYSSLSWLNKIPIDILKIDRSLIINLDNNSKNIAIIKAILAMATTLNIKVIAEGVETEREFVILKELGCHYVQGYLIGKPIPALDFQHNFIK